MGGNRVSKFFLQRTQIRKEKETFFFFFFFFFFWGGGGEAGLRISDFFYKESKSKRNWGGGRGRGLEQMNFCY